MLVRSEPCATTAEGKGREAGEPALRYGGSFRRRESKVKKERERERAKERNASLFQESSVDRTFSFVALIQQPV